MVTYSIFHHYCALVFATLTETWRPAIFMPKEILIKRSWRTKIKGKRENYF